MPESDSNSHLSSNVFFACVIALSQILGVSVVVVVIIWTTKYLGGFGWSGSEYQFNVHPFCMVAGFVFCMTEATLVYRLAKHLPKLTVKILHTVLLTLALVSISVALAAVFKANKGSKVYSLHSWCGLTTLAIFCLQFIIGFVAYMVPHIPYLSTWKLSDSFRRSYMPGHQYFGTVLLFMAAITCVSGLTEYLGGYYGGEKLETVAKIGNSLGVLIVAFVVTTGFIINNDDWKRKSDQQYENLEGSNLSTGFEEQGSVSSSINESN